MTKDPLSILSDEERALIDDATLVDCNACDGYGHNDEWNREPCSSCGGSGRYPGGENSEAFRVLIHSLCSRVVEAEGEAERLRRLAANVHALAVEMNMTPEEIDASFRPGRFLDVDGPTDSGGGE